ncbi:MAG: hypothetical protein M3Y87_28730 [Myxococcota bacterium]|nr:hypothetical protein [Myxococcota bacterium]
MRSYRSFAAVVALLSLSACHSDRRYVTPEGGTTWQLAFPPDAPPFFTGEDLSVFLVEQAIELPVRAPTDEERSALRTADERGLGPYPRRPWVERGAYEILIEGTLSNLSDERQRVAVTVNGINEFHEYMPGVTVVGDDVVVDFSGWEHTYELDPGERVSFTIREEELDEVAVDLATVVNGAPNSNQVVFFQNQSAHDRRSQMYIPPIVPALVGVRLGLRVEAGEDATAAPPAALEAVVRVRDLQDRIVSAGEASWDLPQAAPFAPVTPVE